MHRIIHNIFTPGHSIKTLSHTNIHPKNPHAKQLLLSNNKNHVPASASAFSGDFEKPPHASLRPRPPPHQDQQRGMSRYDERRIDPETETLDTLHLGLLFFVVVVCTMEKGDSCVNFPSFQHRRIGHIVSRGSKKMSILSGWREDCGNLPCCGVVKSKGPFCPIPKYDDGIFSNASEVIGYVIGSIVPFDASVSHLNSSIELLINEDNTFASVF